MILELDISLLDKIGDLSLGQLVFLNLVLNDNQTNHQNVSQLLSLVSETEIQDLIDRELLSIEINDSNKIYSKTDTLDQILGFKQTKFDEFYDLFPAIVQRPDGLRGYLRTNSSKCRKLYNQIIGGSIAKHEHIVGCLKTEITNKTLTGKLGYMKTMWRWLCNQEWEVTEEQMKDESNNIVTIETYGTTVL